MDPDSLLPFEVGIGESAVRAGVLAVPHRAWLSGDVVAWASEDDTDRLQRPSELFYARFHASPLWTGIKPSRSCSPGQWLQRAGSVEEKVPPEVLALDGVWGDVVNSDLSVGAAERLRHLLVITGVQPVVAWSEIEDKPDLSHEGVGVLGLLSLQLVTFLMAVPRWLLPSVSDRPHRQEPSRKSPLLLWKVLQDGARPKATGAVETGQGCDQ
jgi:hypothetical protein